MPSSSLLWSVGSIALSSLITSTIADGPDSQYQLIEDWQGKNFLDYFKFFSGADPTNGFVTYTNQSYAESSGLIEVTSSGSFYMGVDYKTTLSANGPGRDSVRIESKEYYNEGLYIIDLQHMPGSVCGTWPAFWSVGPNWPYDGEIDIIEGVNKHEANKIVLHTSGSCALSGENEMTGTMTSSECGEASGTIGCVVQGKDGTSGAPFNQQGGGIYAMEWTSKFIKIWYFARSEIPKSITEGKPDPTAFGTPMAHLQGTCDFHERFKSQKFIFDTTFCGDWAGGVFGTSGCPVSNPSNPIQSCVNYVAENPAAFKEAYWEINYIKMFQMGAGHTTTSAASQTQTATAAVSETVSDKGSTSSTVVPEAAHSQISATDAEITAAPAETTAAPAIPPSDKSNAGSDAVSETTIYVTSTSTVCSSTTTEHGSIQPLGGGQTGVAPTATAQAAAPSQPGEIPVNGGDPVPSDVSPESYGSSAPLPGAQQPEQSQSGASGVDVGTGPSAASITAPTGQGTPEGASPVDSSGSWDISDEPATASAAPIRGSAPSSFPLIHSSSRVASSSIFASSATVTTPISSTPYNSPMPTKTHSGASTASNPTSPVFTAGAGKSVGLTGMAGILCGLVMAMLA
ncbi:putative endo-1,3(4)-beta-glucanase [Aspergillus coremiiformis]|uniref:endo-1,3(4)-beta-glucanase n=1 Tax=Aspergillus coremiiformis TaxID=138285 RepID=A0A5N6ZGQ0_9EURO|nr:putative endo-1,3(4)-beta-glucanase [Aspergillus coremiiformis]